MSDLLENTNPFLNEGAIQDYLKSVGHVSLRRGTSYFKGGAVGNYQCLEPGMLYSATVRAEMLYKVELEFFEDQWEGTCDCPIGMDCKHCVAALIGFQNEHSLMTSGTAAPAAFRTSEKFEALLAASLKRKLAPDEKKFAARVARFFERTRQGGGLSLIDLRELAPCVTEWSWAELRLWPEPPRSEHELWLYCAYELRRREITLPEFTRAVTDLSIIEPKMRAWRRSGEIQRWLQTLQHTQTEAAAAPAVRQGDVRLVIGSVHACLVFRDGPESEFTPVKAGREASLSLEIEHGRIVLSPAAALLWTLLHGQWGFETITRFAYQAPGASKILNRVFRQPILRDRLVDATGAILRWSPEPLRFEVVPPPTDDDDYEFRLVQPDGSPPAPILAVFPGRPSLYLSETMVYEGPPPHPILQGAGAVKIPAPAVETQPGLEFLGALGLPVPERMAARVRHVKLGAVVRVKLNPSLTSATTEEAVVTVESTHPDTGKELFGVGGWYPAPGNRKASRPSTALTVCDRSVLDHFPGLLDTLGVKWNAYRQAWTLRVTRKFAEVFAPWIESFPPEVELKLEGALETFREEAVTASMSLKVQEAGLDWFDLNVALDISDTRLSEEEYKLLIDARGGYVRLGDKGWKRLDYNLTPEQDEQLARLGLDARDFSAEPMRVHALQLADEAAAKLLPEDCVRQIQERASSLKARVAPEVPAELTACLRPYQVEGFHFLAYLSTNQFGGVLADDMGLGKTIETLAWLSWLRSQPSTGPEGGPHPILVVCPKSVMDNWSTEVGRFLAGWRVRLWRGGAAGELVQARQEADMIVVNYPQLRSLSPEIGQMHWLAVVLDEAQAIKNPESQTAQAARALRCSHRLALSGTPVENRLLDLWSILAFAMPGILGNRAEFLRRYNQKDDTLARRRLSGRVRPFLLRRTKGQVAQDLPDRVEEDILCEMEAAQKTLYQAEYKRARALLLGMKTQQDLNENRFNFLTSLLRLRQICCHPALVNASLLEAESAKVNALADLLEPLMEEGHKVLVFSQFVTMLDILRNILKERKWPHFYLAGETENRGELVQQFQAAPGAAVFLISLKAGGFGLNLTAASYVVLFDPWWNPAVESQAIDRTHRIGQTNKVIAYRLIMKDSIEEKIRVLQRQKAALAEEVLGEERFSQSLTLDDLNYLFADAQ